MRRKAFLLNYGKQKNRQRTLATNPFCIKVDFFLQNEYTYVINLRNHISNQGGCQMKIKRIAHRGFSSEAPENTQASFAMAVEGDFYGVECDIWK